MEKLKQFVFILNYLDVKVDLPFNLCEDYYFKRPNSHQLDLIKSFLKSKTIEFGGQNLTSFYECSIDVAKSDNDSRSYNFQELPIEEQHYFIIEKESFDNSDFYNIIHACEITNIGIIIGVNFIPFQGSYANSGDDSTIYNFFQGFNFYRYLDTINHQNLIYIDNLTFNDIRRNYELIKALPSQHDFVIWVIRNYINLHNIPHNSDLKTLGYFSIVESLLTHQPKDSGDSISRQLINKINLINNRFDLPIDFDSAFSLNLKKAIMELYDYRSSVAHGKKIFFQKDFKKLKSKHYVDEFMALLIRRIISHALREPQLIHDLREC